MTLPQDFIGVDIAKDWIDVFYLSTSRHERIPTAKQALARFAKAASGGLVILEASGGYERPVTEALAKVGTDYARVNPRQAREFARAMGQLAKTDRVDARVLALMGRALNPRPTVPDDPDTARLADLVARRGVLVGLIRAEKNRAGTTRDDWIAKEITLLISVLQDHLTAVEGQIETLIATRDALAAQSARLCSVPGIGPAISAVLIGCLPELGHLDHRQITSLVGLAPHATDSGLHRGKRHIWGGRADVRRALYIAAFIASRYDPALKAFRKRLQDAGKPVKLAITACARKLLTILNAMMKNGQDYVKKAAQKTVATLTESLSLCFAGACKTVVFPGDKAPNQTPATFAKGAGLLVHNAMLEDAPNPLRARIGNGDGRLMRHSRRSHSLASDAALAATEAGMKLLVLRHLILS